MRNYTKNQIKQCTYVKIDENAKHVIIPKYTKPAYKINHCYLVKLNKSCVNNNDDVIASNWNNGTSPKYEYQKIQVNRIVGSMIYADCLSYDFENKCDINCVWTGWLDTTSLTQLAEI